MSDNPEIEYDDNYWEDVASGLIIPTNEAWAALGFDEGVEGVAEEDIDAPEQ